jgi:hypothetical protein
MVAQFSRTIQAPSYDSEDSLESTSVGFNKSLTIEAFEQLREELSDLSIQYLNILRRTGEKFYNAVNGCDSEEVSGIREYSLIAKRYSAFKKTAEQARILYRETADDSQFEKVTVLVEKVSMINGFNTAMSVAKKAHLIPDEKIDYLEGLLFESEDGEKVDGIKAKDIALASKPPEWMETHRVEWVDKANDAEGGKRPIAKGYIVDIEENESDFILRVKLDNKDEILPVEGRKLKILPMPKCSNFVVIRERGESCNKQGILLNQEFNEQGELIGKVTLLDDSSIVSVPFKLIEKIGFPDNIVDKILDPSKLSGTEFVEELKTENSKLKTEVEELKKVPVVDEGLADLARSLESTLQEKEVAIAELSETKQKIEAVVSTLEAENSTLKEQLGNVIATPNDESHKTFCPQYRKIDSIEECQKGDYVFVKNGELNYPATVIGVTSSILELNALHKIDGKFRDYEEAIQKESVTSGRLEVSKMVGQVEYENKLQRLARLETQLKESHGSDVNLEPVSTEPTKEENEKITYLEQEIVQLKELVRVKDEANNVITEMEGERSKVKRQLTVLSENTLAKMGLYRVGQEVLVLPSIENGEYVGQQGIIKSLKGGVAGVKMTNGQSELLDEETEEQPEQLINFNLGCLLPMIEEF